MKNTKKITSLLLILFFFAFCSINTAKADKLWSDWRGACGISGYSVCLPTIVIKDEC